MAETDRTESAVLDCDKCHKLKPPERWRVAGSLLSPPRSQRGDAVR